jgi:hypothetical protein
MDTPSTRPQPDAYTSFIVPFSEKNILCQDAQLLMTLRSRKYAIRCEINAACVPTTFPSPVEPTSVATRSNFEKRVRLHQIGVYRSVIVGEGVATATSADTGCGAREPKTDLLEEGKTG